MYSEAASLHDYTARLFNWRKGCRAVQHGKTLHFLHRKNEGASSITDNAYSFFRYLDDEAVFVYINNNSEPRSLDWSHYSEFVSGPVEGLDVVSGSPVILQDGLRIPARSALIVEFKR